MAPEIRILDQGDAGELFRLRRNALLDSPLAFLASPEDDLASSEAAVRELLDPRRKSVVFGAYDPGLVGMLGLNRANQRKAAHKVNLWGMFVLPTYRGQGVAAQLLDAAVRYVFAGIRVFPEVAEYPDTKQITAQAPTGSQTGEHLWLVHDLEP